ncbi:MAG TPA: cupin domain-containing protein [Anaerolineales bacterium]|jgi:quercetin dioxygenase-like cupin family protein
MTDYTFIADLGDRLPEIPDDSIVSRTLYDGPDAKVTLFGFAAGQELTEHTAAKPAVITVQAGTGHVRLGDDGFEIGPGSWIYMPAHLPHSVRATTQLVFVLQLLK